MTDEVIVDPAVEPVVVEPVVDPPVDSAPPSKEVPAWALTRISKEAAERRAAEDRATAAERRANEAEALAARLAGQGAKVGDPPITPAPVTQSDAQRQAEIRAEAQNQRFYEDTVEVRNRGMAANGQAFTEALNVLGALGFTSSNEAVADVIAAAGKDNAHQMLIDLAKDPEKAVALTNMTPRQRIAELTRMSIAKPVETAVSAVAPPAATKTVSKAPAPPPPVQTSATKVKDAYSDDMDDDEFTACWKERMAKRSVQR
jgi:hypothetical protein